MGSLLAAAGLRVVPVPPDGDSYVAGVRGAPRGGGEKVWGGQLELLAFARAMGVRVEVYAVGMPVVAMGDASAERVARVSYHRKYYGLGEHYNQVIPVE
ncbi:hypothetical protein I4F81_004873 [Pyropia yezoensis]|uniref:Uncharacterized protein n=1 Tax=Pyropia yezoensis TaxID=2788 RepID=A0ACC3BX71_PYRYE|nr:hypothetical protein I4F81_004873 [Neopyropia yezoensis]